MGGFFLFRVLYTKNGIMAVFLFLISSYATIIYATQNGKVN